MQKTNPFLVSYNSSEELFPYMPGKNEIQCLCYQVSETFGEELLGFKREIISTFFMKIKRQTEITISIIFINTNRKSVLVMVVKVEDLLVIIYLWFFCFFFYKGKCLGVYVKQHL